MINLEYQLDQKGGSILKDIILKCNSIKFFMIDLKRIIRNKHSNILSTWTLEESDQDEELSKYILYRTYIDLILPDENFGLKGTFAQNYLTKFNEVLKKILGSDLPGWYPVSSSRSKISYLEIKIFESNEIPEVKEIDSILDIGINKPVGYVQTFILTPNIMEKYESDEYIFLEEKNDNWGRRNILNLNDINWRDYVNNDSKDTKIYNTYVIHLPSYKKFLDLNPEIVQDINKYGYFTLFDLVIFYIINKLNNSDEPKTKLVEALYGKKNIPGINYPN